MNLSTVLQNKQNMLETTIGKNKKQQLEKKYLETELLFGELRDLVNEQYKAWYCGMFYSIGRERVLLLASQARADGSDSKKLFSYLLKKEQS